MVDDCKIFILSSNNEIKCENEVEVFDQFLCDAR